MAEHPTFELTFRQLFEGAVDALLIVDAQGSVLGMNTEAERLLGWTGAELQGGGLDPMVPQRFRRLVESQLPGSGEAMGPPPSRAWIGLSARRRDGSEFPAEIKCSRLGLGADAPALVTVRDLTKSRHAQDALFREKEQAAATLASIADAVVTTDLQGNVTYLNPTAERLTGWRAAEALSQPLGSVLTLISEVTRQPLEDIPSRCIHGGRALDLIDGVLLIRRDGTEVAIADSAAPLRDRNGVVIGVVLVFHDVTERRRAIRKLTHEATHDSLTGLISRQEFAHRLARVTAEATTVVGDHALCYLDLDRFKQVNDLGGHEAGDNLLQSLGRLLAGHLRNRDTIGRLGGDEFGVLLEHCSLAKAEEIANTLQRAIEGHCFEWGGQRFAIGVSVGVVPITASSGRADDVMRAADDACYAAKAAGGNRVHLGRETGPGIHEQTEARWMTRLTRAVDEDHFQLFTQAIVPLRPQPSARPRCEILVCLPDGNGGVETSGSFLPHAERYRLVPAIDRWVVRKTVGLLGAWHQKHPEFELPLCSINLSASSLNDRDLVPALREYLMQHRVPPEALSFEVTEAAALGNFAQVVRLVSQIRATGCGAGIDEFGCGLGSLTYLKALPVDYLKIGGQYVRQVAEDPVYGTLVGAVNEVGRIMGLTTIAEEVESEPVLQKLRSLGMGYAQGLAIGPPVPFADPEGEVALPCVQRMA